MKSTVPLLSLSSLVLLAAIAVACGASSPQNHTLESITVNPATADANGNPVQFSATGIYDAAPIRVTPQPATWGACYQGVATTDVSVSSSGLAQCASGASGTYTVFAYDIVERGCPQWVNGCGGGGCNVTGTAQLTCP